MSQPVGFGVIGANSFVANAAVLPAIDAASNAQLVATASRSSDVPERWADTDVGSYEAVLTHPDVEAVYIPLPNGMHQEWTEKAAAAGKHVLCEKPLAADAATARAMAEACARAGVQLGEAWMTPFHGRYQEVVRRALAGDIGDIVTIDGAFRFTIGPDANDNYRWDPDQGGGALLDVGIYCLGAIVEIFGAEPTAIMTAQTHRGGVDASTHARLDWPGECTGFIGCSFVDEEFQQLAISGTRGAFVISTEAFTGGIDDTEYLHITEPPSELPLGTRRPERDLDATRTVHADANDAYQAMVEAFAASIRGGAEWPRPVERSIEMLELIERIQDSAMPDPEQLATSVVPVDEFCDLTSGVTLHVQRWEPPAGVELFGRPWVLTHGLASNARLWDGVARRLAARGSLVYTVDQRGHGQSSKPDDGYDVANCADDLALLIDLLQLKHPAVAGQSWGGNVALELGHRHPDAVAMVACVDGGFIDLREAFPSWEDCAKALAPPRLAGTPLDTMRGWIDDSAADWPDEGRAGTMANFEVRDDGTIAPWLTFERHLTVLRGLWEHSPSDVYPNVRVPTLLIGADNGDVSWTSSKRDAVDAAVAALPVGRAHWFSPAHHDVHAQQPAAMTELLHAASHDPRYFTTETTR